MPTTKAEDGVVYWPYNETFGCFRETPLAGRRAQEFVDKNNLCKGGHWVLCSPEEYQRWYEAKGQHLEWLKVGVNLPGG